MREWNFNPGVLACAFLGHDCSHRWVFAALQDKIECKIETWRVAGCNVISVVFVEQEETAIIVYLFHRRGILVFINLIFAGFLVILTLLNTDAQVTAEMRSGTRRYNFRE